MEMYTDMPAMQLYTANNLQNDRVCKDEAVYRKHNAFCLETQFTPNSLA